MKKGWQTKKLREVCELVNGRAYSKPELLAAGKYRVLRVGNFFTNDHWYHSDMELEEKKYCDTGDLLYAWSASFGPRMWTGGKVIYHYHIWKVVHDRTQIDQKFLFYFFQWDTEKIKEDQGTGTTMMHVSMGSMNERDIHLPPLAEQQRIVGLLDEAFEGIATAKANAEKNLQNARALFESHLQSVFTQRGPGWVEKRLGDLVTRLTNGYVGPTRNIYNDSGVPYLLARHVKDNRLQFDGKTFISDEFNRKNKKSMLKAGDVLLVQSGHIGHSAVVTEEHVGHNCHAMIVITAVEGAFIGPFLSLFFNSSGMKQKFQEIRSGSTVPHLTCGEVKELMIPLPDLATQRRVVAHAQELSEETQNLARLYERKLAALAALKKSLLHQAFTGEL